MSKTTKRLGRGLSSLVSAEIAGPPDRPAASGEVWAPSTGGQADAGAAVGQRQAVHRLRTLPIAEIRRNPMQPRRTFDEAALASLADSMKRRGTLQPVVVRPSGGGYELIAGERRLRAAGLAGLKTIPAIVRSVPDDELLELALIENLQREDLDPVERARAYQIMRDVQGLSAEEIAARTGEDRATVTNYIRLLGLSPEVLAMLASRALSAGQAKAILGLSDHKSQLDLAHRVVSEHWSVRRTEAAVAAAREKRPPERRRSEKRAAVADMEERLTAALGAPVSIVEGRRRHTGRVIITYYNLDDFERITGRLGVDVEDV